MLTYGTWQDIQLKLNEIIIKINIGHACKYIVMFHFFVIYVIVNINNINNNFYDIFKQYVVKGSSNLYIIRNPNEIPSF